MNRLARLFLGPGRLPADLRAALVADGPVVLEEGLTGSVSTSTYRAGRTRPITQSFSVSGAVAVTPRRLVVWAGRFKHIDVPLDHPLRATIGVERDRGNGIRFSYTARPIPDVPRPREVTVRLRTPHAARIAELLAPPA